MHVPGAQARASRLSFGDIVKRLAATPEGAPTFVSKKARAPCPENPAHRSDVAGMGCSLEAVLQTLVQHLPARCVLEASHSWRPLGHA